MSYQYDRFPNAFSRDDAHYLLGVMSGEVMNDPKLGSIPSLLENARDEIFANNYDAKKCRMAGAKSDAVLAGALHGVISRFKGNAALFETCGLDAVDMTAPTRIVDQSRAHIIDRITLFLPEDKVETENIKYGIQQFIEIGELFVRDAYHQASDMAALVTRDLKITAYDGYEKSIAAKFNKPEIKG